MTDDELVEKMLDEYFGKIRRTFSGGQHEVCRDKMRAALSIAKPIIRDDALEGAKAACVGELLTDPDDGDDADEAYDMAVRDCIAAVDALKSKGQKP